MQAQAKLEQEVERFRKAMGLQDGAQQLMQQQQQAVAEAGRAKAALAAATERMQALLLGTGHGKDGDVFEGVEAELQGLRAQVEQLQQKMKRLSLEEKIAARQQALDQEPQTSATVAAPAPASASPSAPLSLTQAPAAETLQQVLLYEGPVCF
jgi:transcription initiation factor TFIIIB Brf1 subunit/transcription initiation factor TFIIB